MKCALKRRHAIQTLLKIELSKKGEKIIPFLPFFQGGPPVTTHSSFAFFERKRREYLKSSTVITFESAVKDSVLSYGVAMGTQLSKNPFSIYKEQQKRKWEDISLISVLELMAFRSSSTFVPGG